LVDVSGALLVPDALSEAKSQALGLIRACYTSTRRVL